MYNNFYFYTPEIPVFIVTNSCEVVRARVLRYLDGKFNGALVDYNAFESSCDFLGKGEFLPDAAPFYCAYINVDGDLEMDQRTVREMAMITGMDVDEVQSRIYTSCAKVECPTAKNEDHGRSIVFHK